MTAIALFDVLYCYERSGFVLSCPRLELRLGELTLITGPNGSGKTTLSKLMCGILRPKQGRISIFGRRADELSLGRLGVKWATFSRIHPDSSLPPPCGRKCCLSRRFWGRIPSQPGPGPNNCWPGSAWLISRNGACTPSAAGSSSAWPSAPCSWEEPSFYPG